MGAEGHVRRPFLKYFSRRLDVVDAARRLDAGEPVLVDSADGRHKLESAYDAVMLAALSDKRNQARDIPQAQMLRALALGLRKDDGLQQPGHFDLAAYEAYKRLQAREPVSVRCGQQHRQIGSLDELGGAYEWALSRFEMPFATSYERGEPVRYVAVPPESWQLINACIRLAFPHFVPNWYDAGYYDYLQASKAQTTLAVTDKGVVAMLQTQPGREGHDGEFYVAEVAVMPQAQGKKLGETMMTHLLDDMREKGYRSAYLHVEPDNVGAHHLYEKLGFKDGEYLPTYYFQKDPARVMELPALPSGLYLNHAQPLE